MGDARGRDGPPVPLYAQMVRALITARTPPGALAPLPLSPVANKPLLAYGLEALRDAGATDVTVLVDAEHERAVGDLVGDGSRWGLYAGVASDAAWRAGGGPLVVLSGRGLVLDGLSDALAAVECGGAEALHLTVAGTPIAAVLAESAVARLAPSADPWRSLADAGVHAGTLAVAGAWAGGAEDLLEANRLVLDGLAGGPCAAAGAVVIQGRVEVHPTADV